jgi:hypothetical protein
VAFATRLVVRNASNALDSPDLFFIPECKPRKRIEESNSLTVRHIQKSASERARRQGTSVLDRRGKRQTLKLETA